MVGLVTCLGHFAGTVDIPTHLRRILLADVNARFRIGLALRRILGESSTLEVLRFVIVERVFGGVLAGKHSAVGQGDWSVDLHHLLDEHRIHGNQTVDVAGILRTLP